MYVITALDEDRSELAASEAATKAEAVEQAETFLRDKELQQAGATKVEITSRSGVCVWDRFTAGW